MRHSFFISLLFWVSSQGFSQTKPSLKNIDKIFCCSSEKDAEVDIKHWQAYLDKNLQLDSTTQDTIPEGTYSITAMFIIGKNGCIDEVKILNGSRYGLGEKVSRVISEYEQWVPAERNGRKVRAYRKLVLTIVAKKEECKGSFAEFIL